MKPQFSTPEAKFVIACLCAELQGSAAKPLPPQELDWTKTLDFLLGNRLAPLFAVLAANQKEVFPEHIRDRLKQERYSLLLYGDQCQEQVRTVLGAFHNSAIPVIVLKGWALITWLYGGDFGQRFCEDIDILVPLDKVKLAEGILANLGYAGLKEIDPGYNAALSNARAYQKVDQSGVFLKPFTIGLHWGLTHFPYYDKDLVDTGGLFGRAMPLQVAGVGVAELAYEDQVVYTCAHLALHHRNQENLLNYYEIAAILKRAGTDFNWTTAIERALGWKYFVQLRLVLKEMDALFPGKVPAEAMQKMAQVRVSWRERWLDRLVAKSKGNQFRSALVELIALPGFRNKVRQTWLNLFPPRAYMQFRYGTTETSLAKLYWRRVRSAWLGLFQGGKPIDPKAEE